MRRYRLIALLALMLGAVGPALTLGLSEGAEPLAKRYVFENGLTLLVAEKRALPIVTVHVVIKAGSLVEPKEKAGLANLVASLLTRGTKTRSAVEISEAIEFVGGSLTSQGGADVASVGLTVLRKDLDLGLNLLTDVLLHPAFEEQEIQRKMKEIVGAIRKKKEEPGEVAEEAFNALVFGDHPYGRPVEGTEETLKGISRKDIQAFYEAYVRPERTIVAVVGDVGFEEMVAKFQTLFGSWKRGEALDPPLPTPPSLEGPKVKKIHRNLTQANIVLGHLGIKRENPDFYAVQVMNYILGSGGFASRLMANIRDEKGWAYDVDSHFVSRLQPGPFMTSLQTKNETAQPAVEEVLKEIRRIREEPVREEELKEAKAYLTGSFPLRLDTNAEIAQLLTGIELYGLGLDYVERYPTLIEAVTREEVLRVAKRYLDPERFVLVVVADQEKAQVKPATSSGESF